MKKLLVLLLGAVLVFSLAACGNKDAQTAETTEAAAETAAETAAEAANEESQLVTPVQPENYGKVDLGEYKGIEVALDDTAVTEDDVQTEIDNALANYLVDVTDRPVQNGDVVNIDYEGKKDGVAFDGGTAQGASLAIGSGQFIAGFEDGLLGAKIGETRDLELKFPDDYWNEDLAGADVVFTVKVNGIKAGTDKLTDEWVRDYTRGKCNTVDEFKVRLKEDLEEYAERSAEENAKSELLQQVLDNSEFKPEQDAIDYEYQQLKESYRQYVLQYYGVSLEDYLTAYGMDEEALKNELMTYAETSVDQKLAINEIFALEGMKIEAEDEQALADIYGVSVEEIKNAVGDEAFEQNARTTKVLQFLYDNAKVK